MSTVVGALRFDLGLNTAAFDSGLDRADGKAKSFAGGIVRAFAPIAGAIAAAFSVRAIAQMTDAWSDMNSRLRRATGSAEAGAAAMDRLQEVARRSYSSITQTTEAFLSQTTALNALGVSVGKQLDLTETLNNALVISATRGDKARSVMDAWGKAMATGTLRGQNLNSVIAGSDRLAQALADSMGINVTELQKYGAEGKITREVMLGVTSQLEKLREEAAEMPATISDGMTIISDSVQQLVGRLDQALGASEAFAGWMVSIGDAISAMTPYIVGAATAITAALAPAFDMLVSGLSVFGNLVPIVGSALVAYFGVTAVGMIGNLAYALGTTLVAAIRAVGVAMMANPIGLIVAAIAAAIAAVFVFRDTIRDVFGIDVVTSVKDAANVMIGTLVGAYEGIVEAWEQLPAAFSDVGTRAMNALDKAIVDGLNIAIERVKGFIKFLSPITLAADLLGFGDVGQMMAFPEFTHVPAENPNEGAAAGVVDTIRRKISDNQEVDWVGGLTDAVAGLRGETELTAEQLEALNERIDGTGSSAGGAGKAVKDELQAALEAMRVALMTEEEAERNSYAQRLLDIQEFYDKGLIQKQEYDDLMERAHQAHSERMTEITKRQVEEEARIRSQMVGHATSIFGSLSTIMQNFGEENLGASKAFAVAAAIINTAEGITKALAQGGMLGFAGAAAVAAAGAAQISTIMTAQKGGGRRPTVGRGGSAVQAAPEPQLPDLQRQQAVSITLQGDYHPTAQVEQMIDELLKMQRDGFHIVLERT